MPLFTIITVVYNAIDTIERSVLSVIEQEEKDLEYIVIDGGSTDGTVDVVNKYINKINYFVSEKDAGIYNAMNKGIEKANGSYLIFLGADDFLYNTRVLLDVKKKIFGRYYDVMAGNIIYTNDILVKSSFSKKLLLHNSLHHQGMFYNRQLFNNFRYDTGFKLISDYELNLILFLKRKHIKFLNLDMMISLCSDNGASRRQLEIFAQETDQIRLRHMSSYKAKIFSFLFVIKLKIWNAIRHK